MSRKNSPSSNSNSTNSDDSCNSWIESNSYNLERFFPHMFKLLLQQMRLQRAIISFLTAKEEVATDKDATFEVVLKDSIIKEKQDLLKILDKHLSHLQDVGAPDAIVVGKKTQMVAVEGGTVELGWAEPREILNSTLGMLNDAILTEYLDLVTDFVGEDSNWPIDSDNSDGEDLVNEMLRS